MKKKMYLKPEMEESKLESQPIMLETSEIGLVGEGEGDAIGRRNPFGNPFGGNPFSKPFGF